jgi:hypothetical protein
MSKKISTLLSDTLLTHTKETSFHYLIKIRVLLPGLHQQDE